MSARLETDLEKRVCRQAEQEGWQAWKLVRLGHRGFPDRWFVKPGPIIVIIEFKRKGKKVRKLQKYVCDMMEVLGFNVWWDVDDYSVAMEILRDYDE